MWKKVELINKVNKLSTIIESYINDTGILLTFFEDVPIQGEFNTFKSVNQYGKSIYSTSLGEKEINIEGIILADNREQIELLKNQLVKVLNPLNDVLLKYSSDYISKEIIIRADHTPKFSTDYKTNNNIALAFKCSFTGSYPFWRSIKEYETTLVTWRPNLEFPKENKDNDITQFHTEQTPNYWLETGPQFEEFLSEFGTGVGQEWGYRELKQIVEINNIGDVECPIRVVFRANGDVEKPYIQDVESYELIRINKTLKSGDLLEIITGYGNKNVYLNGKKAQQYLDFLNSTWIQLKPGINLIKYGAQSNLSNLECTVFYTPLYLGV